MLSRRNALTVLGIASVGAAAEDALAQPKINGLPTGQDYDRTKHVAALRALADEIERTAIIVEKLKIETEVDQNSIVMQRLSIDFIIKDVA